ncbi:MAG TPA: hypothetical protein VKB88_45095 [Bryobacteraceae bacterium]|nr:hypothetical protein [Bryobacteraceae bacterium]
MPDSPRALFVTYTFGNPIVAGVLFRAIRLATELTRRGWTSVIFNFGPVVGDPKTEALGSHIEIRNHPDTSCVGKALDQFRGARPDVVIFGEAPFAGAMKLLWDAAEMLGKPFILLEQYYDLGTPGNFDVDLMLLYGLKCFWECHSNPRRRWTIISPFITEVTPEVALPLGPPPEGARRLLILGGEQIVRQEGIRLAAALSDLSPQVVTLSRDPSAAADEMATAGIPSSHAVALPLQHDGVLFGLLQSSAAAIMANGFMQMTEALALACPCALVDRGIGMWSCQVDGVFQPYVSFADDWNEQRTRLRGWLEHSPFDPVLREKLRAERNGASECAEHVERVLAGRNRWRIRWRQATYQARHFGNRIGERFHQREAAA